MLVPRVCYTLISDPHLCEIHVTQENVWVAAVFFFNLFLLLFFLFSDMTAIPRFLTFFSLNCKEYKHDDNPLNMSRHDLLSLIYEDDMVTHEMIHCSTCFSRRGKEFILRYPFLCPELLVTI